MNKRLLFFVAMATFTLTFVFTSCKNKRETGWQYAPNMYDSKAYKANTPNANFKNGLTDQVPPANTEPIGYTNYTIADSPEGLKQADGLVNTLEVNDANLAEGKTLFITFCSPCHGDAGDGKGHLVTIGKFGAVPSYHEGESSRGGEMADLSSGRIYHTIMHGLNSMGSYSSQLKPKQRWQVVMYVKQLQIKK